MISCNGVSGAQCEGWHLRVEGEGGDRLQDGAAGGSLRLGDGLVVEELVRAPVGQHDARRRREHGLLGERREVESMCLR